MLANVTLLAADRSLTDDLIISRILLGKREYYEPQMNTDQRQSADFHRSDK